MSDSYDVIVVGAGAVGSAAAYHSAKAGKKTLLLEQFEIDHQHGSSHGQSRIIRFAYDHPVYVNLAKHAFPAWKALEQEIGESLWVQTGGLDFGAVDERSMQETIDSLNSQNVPFDLLTPEETHARFPQFRLDDNMIGIYQADAGALFASKCVRAHVTLAQKHGAVVREHAPLRKLTIHEDSVEVETPDARYTAARLILVPGAWAKMMFASIGLNVPLTIIKTQECYFDAQPARDYEAGRFPVFIAHQREDFGLWTYGLPSVNGSGLKTGLHGGTIADNPDTMDRAINQDIIDRVREFFRRHIPAGDAPLTYARVCLYTNTPDEHFIIDRHPLYPHVILSSSCSGHGFKFSGVVGEILTQLAIDGASTYDIETFKLARFDHVLA